MMSRINSEDFVSVYRPYDTTQAGLIQNALEDKDILCYVNNENASTVRFGGIGFGAAGMAVMVPKRHEEKARSIIAALGFRE